MLLLCLGVVGAAWVQPDDAPASAPAAEKRGDVRFTWIDVFVDSGAALLAAYQVEVKAAALHAAEKDPASPMLVGVEGGEHAAFADAPYYDPAALHDGAGERIVLAAFSTDGPGRLPSGNVRVARLHVRVNGGAPTAGYEARLVTAADADGTRIEAAASLSEGDSR